MLQFFTGKPGDGKSLFTCRQILDALTNGEAFNVTNLPLNFPAVNAYVVAKRKAKGLDGVFVIDERLKVLNDSDVLEFYRHRSGGLVLPPSPDFEVDPRNRLARPEFIEAMKKILSKIKENEAWQLPVNYWIDEAHNFFSAREWASAGRGLLY